MALRGVTGVEQVIAKMRTIGATKIGPDIGRGLTNAGKFLQRKSQEVVPKQIGDLHDTAFTRNIGGVGLKTDILVGYTAEYAAVVHEDLTKAHGKEFNIKHAEEIANAGKWSSSLKTKRTTFRPTRGKQAGTAAGGMFPRGENQQAKYLEGPMRMFRREILKKIYGAAKF